MRQVQIIHRTLDERCENCGSTFLLEERVWRSKGWTCKVSKYLCDYCGRVVMRMKLNRKPPFQNTKIDPEKSRQEIDAMLRDFGAESVQWTTEWKLGKVNLKFLLPVEKEGVKKTIGVDIDPPLFAMQHKTYNPQSGQHEKIIAPNYAASMRMLFWWLKAKLEGIIYGMGSAEHEFLSHVMVTLPSGQATTVGEAIIGDALTSGRLLLTEVLERNPNERELEGRIHSSNGKITAEAATRR